MSFSSEIFKKKLDALQETQDSIVSISQWVLFHHRHATQLCELWADYALTDAGAQDQRKKLSLLYLCNDVVQQARHKRKPEFALGFASNLPKTLHFVYGAVDESIKPKIERLISVWNDRNIFSKAQIASMNEAVKLSKLGKAFDDATVEIATSKQAGSSSATEVATDLVHLNKLYNHMAQLQETSSSNLTQVGLQSKKYLPDDHSTQDNLPSPKVYISKLSVLKKLCNITAQNLEDTKKTKLDILKILADLTNSVSSGLSSDDSKLEILQQKLSKVESTTQELYEIIDESAPTEETETTSDSTSNQNLGNASDDLIPTYENPSDESDEDTSGEQNNGSTSYDIQASKRRKLSDSSVTSNSSKSSKKSVAFSEDVQVKEYERDEQSEASHMEQFHIERSTDDDSQTLDINEFTSHHKDDLELMRERQSGSDDDGYDGSSQHEENDNKNGLFNLLSRLN